MIKRNRDFQCLICDGAKGQKNGLRWLKVEEDHDVMNACKNK